MGQNQKKKLALSTQIFIALVLAIIAGIALTGAPDFAQNYIKPFGTIFLNLIKWVVCPLVFFSIITVWIRKEDSDHQKESMPASAASISEGLEPGIIRTGTPAFRRYSCIPRMLVPKRPNSTLPLFPESKRRMRS